MRRFGPLCGLFMLLTMFGLTQALAGGEARTLSEELLTHLTKGFDELSLNRLASAQEEFAKVIRVDFDNPFANNNLAVIMEKQGKMADALAYLKVAETFAGAYHYKVETLYLIGGVLAALKPEKAAENQTQVAKIISDNKRKLIEKMGLAQEDLAPLPDK